MAYRMQSAGQASARKPISYPAANGAQQGRRIVTRNLTPEEAMVFLTKITEKLIREENLSTRTPELPPPLPEGTFSLEEEMEKVTLLEEDLQLDRPPKSAALTRLCQLLVAGRYTALGMPPPLKFREVNNVVGFNFQDPASPKGESVHLAVSHTTAHITKSIAHRSPIRNVSSKEGYPYIPATDHMNCCLCPALIANNNVQTLQYFRACLPACMYIDYPENPDLPDAKGAPLIGRKHLNPSNVYFSTVSSCGTVLPRLLMRSPISVLERQMPKYRESIFAGVDVMQSYGLLRAIAAHTSRDETRRLTAKINLSCKPLDDNTDAFKYRFSRFNIENDADLAGFGNAADSPDDVLANHTLTEIFDGVMSCPYCSKEITVETPVDLLDHFLCRHQLLKESFFSCPGCLSVEIYDHKSYQTHFKERHRHLSLMLVLTETNLSTRLQTAMILSLFLGIPYLSADIDYVTNEQPHFTSALGGYGQNKERIYSEVIEAQLACVPEQLQAEIRQGTEFLTENCVEQFHVVYKPKSLSTKKNKRPAPQDAMTYSQIASPKPPQQNRTPSPMEGRKRTRNPSPPENQPTRKRSPRPAAHESPARNTGRHRKQSPAPRRYRSTSESSMPPRRRSTSRDYSPVQHRRRNSPDRRRRSPSTTPTPPNGWAYPDQEYQHEMNRYMERDDRRVAHNRQRREADHTTPRTRLYQRLDFQRRERSVTPDDRYSRFRPSNY